MIVVGGDLHDSTFALPEGYAYASLGPNSDLGSVLVGDQLLGLGGVVRASGVVSVAERVCDREANIPSIRGFDSAGNPVLSSRASVELQLWTAAESAWPITRRPPRRLVTSYDLPSAAAAVPLGFGAGLHVARVGTHGRARVTIVPSNPTLGGVVGLTVLVRRRYWPSRPRSEGTAGTMSAYAEDVRVFAPALETYGLGVVWSPWVLDLQGADEIDVVCAADAGADEHRSLLIVAEDA